MTDPENCFDLYNNVMSLLMTENHTRPKTPLLSSRSTINLMSQAYVGGAFEIIVVLFTVHNIYLPARGATCLGFYGVIEL